MVGIEDLEAGQHRVENSLAFEDFYRREFRPVVGLAYALTGSRTISEELAQDAFAEAFKRWQTLSQYDKPEAWVRRVLVNRSRSWGRRQAVELKAMARIRGRRQKLAELAEPDHEFWVAVRSLPTRQCQAITLHYLDDLPVAEIGSILECSPGSVKTHLHRGRKALTQLLALAPDDDEAPTDGAHKS